MKKNLLLISCLLVVGGLFAQNEFGGYTFPHLSSTHNAANRQGDAIYQPEPTITYGIAASFSHHLNKGKTNGPIRHGALSSSLKIKKLIRVDLIYLEHNQKFKSEYRLSPTKDSTHYGKKRLSYLQVPVMFQLTTPLSKKVNFSVFGGPQFSFLTKAQGGNVYWVHNKDQDYFDLPFSSRDYYKKITMDATGGFNFEFKATRWVHILTGMKMNYSLTTAENTDATSNNYPVYGIVDGYNKERGNGHNSSLALTVGVMYQFHKAEHHKTRF